VRERWAGVRGERGAAVAEGLLGVLLVVAVTADYVAFVEPTPIHWRLGLLLSVALLVGVVTLTGYILTAVQPASDRSGGRRSRFGVGGRRAAVVTLLVTAGLTALVFRQSVRPTVVTVPIYVYNSAPEPMVLAATASFVVDPNTRPPNGEPATGRLLQQTSEDRGIAGADITVGPRTSLTVLGQVVSPERFLRTLATPSTQVTILLVLRYPDAGATLSTNECSLVPPASGQIACTLRRS
jgi:hypothetical protein